MEETVAALMGGLFNASLIIMIMATMLAGGLATTLSSLGSVFKHIRLLILVLITALVLRPLVGWGLAAVFGLGGKMADYGIDDDFIKSTRDQVTEGTSALFLLTSDGVKDKVAAELKDEKFELIASNLTKEQEEELMAAFSEE